MANKSDLRAMLEQQLAALCELEAATRAAQANAEEAIAEEADEMGADDSEGAGDPSAAFRARMQGDIDRISAVIAEMLGRKSGAVDERKDIASLLALGSTLTLGAGMVSLATGKTIDDFINWLFRLYDAERGLQDEIWQLEQKLADKRADLERLVAAREDAEEAKPRLEAANDKSARYGKAKNPPRPDGTEMSDEEVAAARERQAARERRRREERDRTGETEDEQRAREERAFAGGGGDVEVRDYERDGHTVHGYTRRRKKSGGAHLIYS